MCVFNISRWLAMQHYIFAVCFENKKQNNCIDQVEFYEEERLIIALICRYCNNNLLIILISIEYKTNKNHIFI